MSKEVELRSKTRVELEEIFNRHKYENEYGNRVGYRIQDVMSNIQEYYTRHQDSVLEELQATQERIEILESENQQLKMEFNSVLEDIEREIKEKYVKADYCCFRSVDGALAILAKHKTTPPKGAGE